MNKYEKKWKEVMKRWLDKKEAKKKEDRKREDNIWRALIISGKRK